eukprot:3662208-Rhodomonas_salina.1
MYKKTTIHPSTVPGYRYPGTRVPGYPPGRSPRHSIEGARVPYETVYPGYPGTRNCWGWLRTDSRSPPCMHRKLINNAHPQGTRNS